MSSRAQLCPSSISRRLTILALLLIVSLPYGSASAQMGSIDLAQSDLVKKPPAEQSVILAEAVRGAWKGRSCTSPKVSLEKTYNDGGGGWLVLCDEGQDYWVAVFGDRPKPGVGVLPCIVARQSGTDCYANLRTILPDDIKQCGKPSGSLDRVIRSCTAIIQSHQLDSRPDALYLVYGFRALAFSGYQQFELAIADFDKAVALQRANMVLLFNRAVALERKGELDQALNDLAKVIAAKPDDETVLFERGYVYLKKGEYDRAIDDFDTVLRANPQLEKAIRARADAVKAKENPPSPQPPAGQTAAFPQTSDEQAAYCLEASFGFSQRLTKLAAILRENREKGQTLLDGTTLSLSERTQLAAQMNALSNRIASNDAEKKSWDANGGVFITYAQKNGLFTNSKLISSMSGQVRKDQEAVSSIYNGCLRGCPPNDDSCRAACNDKANGSDAHKHMLHCAEIAARFK